MLVCFDAKAAIFKNRRLSPFHWELYTAARCVLSMETAVDDYHADDDDVDEVEYEVDDEVEDEVGDDVGIRSG